MSSVDRSEEAKLLARAEHDPDVLAVIRFGSVSRGESHPQSDLDVCLVLHPQLGNPSPQNLAQKRMSYLEFDLDVQIFQALPLYIRRRVLRDGLVLFIRHEPALYELALRTVQQYEDFRPLYHDYLNQVIYAGS